MAVGDILLQHVHALHPQIKLLHLGLRSLVRKGPEGLFDPSRAVQNVGLILPPAHDQAGFGDHRGLVDLVPGAEVVECAAS